MIQRNELRRNQTHLVWIGILSACLLLPTVPVWADVFFWDNYSDDDSWDTRINWNPYPPPPANVPGPGDTAVFNFDVSTFDRDNEVDVTRGTIIDVMKVIDTAVVNMTIEDGTVDSRFDLDDTFGNSLIVGDSNGDVARFTLLGGWLDTHNALISGQATLAVDGPGAYWDSSHVLISGDTSTTTAQVNVLGRGQIKTNGNLDVGSDVGSGRAVVQTTGFGSEPSLWQVTASVDVGPTATNGFNFGELYAQGGGEIDVAGDLNVHGTDSITSKVIVRTGGLLAVGDLLQIGPYGVLELHDATSTVTADDIDNNGGTFDWTAGTLRVTGSNLQIDSSSQADLGTDALTVGSGMSLKLEWKGMPWDPLPNLKVGADGHGSMTIENGGVVESYFGHIGVRGASGSATGSVAVSGADSRWTVVNLLQIGRFTVGASVAHGELNISDGAQVSAIGIGIGLHDGQGTVTVDGAGSTLSGDYVAVGGGLLSSSIAVGGGVGSLTVQNDAVVEASVQLTLNSPDDTVELLGGQITAGSFLNDQGGTFTHADGMLTVDGGVFNPGPGDYTIDGLIPGDLPTVKLTGGASGAESDDRIIVGDANRGVLEIHGPSVLTSKAGDIGYQATSIGSGDAVGGSVLVTGNGAQWTLTGTGQVLFVGVQGEGELTIADGGLVQGNIHRIGLFAGSSGHVIVRDPGSSLVAYDGIGVAESSVLDVVDGGFVDSGTSTLAIAGEVNVVGDGSTLSGGFAPGGVVGIAVGLTMPGSLNIHGGGQVEDRSLIMHIGSNAEGVARVVGVGAMTGIPSTLTLANKLAVGKQARGDLEVADGGQVIVPTDSLYIGVDAGSDNSALTVTGTGPTDPSTVQIGDSLFVGGHEVGPASSGRLTVSNGGVVDVAGELKIWNMGKVELLGSEIRTGSFLNDEGGTFTHDDGILTVDGGTFDPGVSNYTLDGAAPSGLSEVRLLNGAAASLSGSNIYVGFNNRARLEIAAGSSVVLPDTAASIDIAAISGSHGEIVVDGQGSRLTTYDGLAVGLHGDGALRIRNGGSVDDVSATASENGPIAWGTGSIGFAEVVGTAPNGTPSTWTTHNTLQVGWAGVGELSIAGGGRVNAQNDAAIAWHPISSNGSGATVEGSGPRGPSTWDVTGSLYVGGHSSGPGGTGTLTVSNGGQVDVSSRLHVWKNSSASVDLASWIDVGTGVGAVGVLTVHHGGILSGNGTVIAVVRNDSGTVAPDDLPDDSPGTLTIQGSYEQTVSGTLDIEIGGASSAQYDQLNIVAGSAALDGFLDVVLIDPLGGSNFFVPQAGDSFEILTADGGLGGTTFDTVPVDLPALPGLMWDIFYGSDFVRLDVLTAYSADFDRDGDVDGDDLTQWEGDFGQNGDSDANGDGDSGGADFLIWQRQLGSGSSTVMAGLNSVVPEPAAEVLLIGLFTVLILKRQGKCS